MRWCLGVTGCFNESVSSANVSFEIQVVNGRNMVSLVMLVMTMKACRNAAWHKWECTPQKLPAGMAGIWHVRAAPVTGHEMRDGGSHACPSPSPGDCSVIFVPVPRTEYAHAL